MRKSRKLERQYTNMQKKRNEYNTSESERVNKENQAKAEKKAKADEEKAERNTKLTTTLRNLNDFQKTDAGKKLNMGVDFQAAESDYLAFGRDVAALDWGVPKESLDWPKIDQSMKKYLAKNPRLMDTLVEKGIAGREPKSMRKYLILSEVNFYREGKTMADNGTWVQNDWSHPDMDSAYYHWKREKGINAQDMIDAAEKGADEMLKAISQPGTVELQHGDGGKEGSEIKVISKEEALKNFELLDKQAKEAGHGDSDEWIEMLSRNNPEDPRVKMYEKSLTVLEA